MISDEELVEKILRFRVKYKMTQKIFAKKSGISFSTLNLLENLKASPTKTTKTKIIMFMEEYTNDLETNN